MLYMDKDTYLSFYTNTVLGYSKMLQKSIVCDLRVNGLIQIGETCSLLSPVGKTDVECFQSTDSEETILRSTSSNLDLLPFYEELEFCKIYKYSVPFFYESESSVLSLLRNCGCKEFRPAEFSPEFYIASDFEHDMLPLFFNAGDNIIILKFVVQKHYFPQFDLDSDSIVDYRYPVIVSIDAKYHVLEIRYDALKYAQNGYDFSRYERCVSFIVSWLKNKLGLSLFSCNTDNFISIIKEEGAKTVKIYRQMMDLSSGGAAELTAASGEDCILPFIGEIRQLIDENEEMFSRAENIRKLLLDYIEEKESTASYPYVYLKWLNPVESSIYAVKVTLNSPLHQSVLMQHLTGSCRTFRRERMDNAIRYLCESKAID